MVSEGGAEAGSCLGRPLQQGAADTHVAMLAVQVLLCMGQWMGACSSCRCMWQQQVHVMCPLLGMHCAVAAPRYPVKG
jgi:hypothetical protein